MKKKAANIKKEKIKNRSKELKKLIDYSIPGYPEISDWDILVKPPFSIGLILNFRCYSDTVFIIEDANKTPFTFFFDGFLGRLCFGAESYREETAAYIKANSKLEKEAFAAIESAINDFQSEFSGDYHGLSLIRERLEKAKVYAGSKDIVPSFLLDKAR
ncbi:hypothetical protein H1P_580021 [Hyella patelloides LEGE 07179]|uniref:Uncharacterized protein n=1 Tax=Hyella patelloides LEGE 07179 TaxID=945734 RepID=A0A563W0Q6_9CYAN|nr:hypothetical protein [Hyella patelloides]VEP17274.1 hypothetical protein H1P_580021 [Hyella patelloides LEGE 07179]